MSKHFFLMYKNAKMLFNEVLAFLYIYSINAETFI
jgi:hypothetical protein